MQGNARVGDADRDAAAFRLREHYSTGRLTLTEFQQRLDAAYQAQTGRELAVAAGDLPHVPAFPGAWERAAAGWTRRGGPSRRGWARLGRRFLLALGILTAGGVAAVALLAFLLLHGGLLAAALLVLLLLTMTGIAAAVGVAWIARRMWRRGAWLEALPLLAGQPWLSRVVWAARALWTGHALWRLRARILWRLRARVRPEPPA